MIITIDRAWKKQDYTISRVFINHNRFGDGKNWCSILEDNYRGLNSAMSLEQIKAIKVYGRTAIPSGVYEIKLYASSKFGVVPLLLNVPGYTGILIHPGNTAKDTDGCLLPGINSQVGKVLNSRYWTSLLISKIKESLKTERVYIEVL